MTILSNSHDFVFVHLHKCGGSSVEIAYQPHAKWNDIVLGSTDAGERLQHIYRKLHGLHKHSTAAEIQDVVGPFWNEAWTFSLIRHPVSIMESFYRWIHKLIDNFAQTSEQPFDVVLDKIRNKVVDRPFMQYEVTQPFANAEDFNDFVMRFSKKSTLGTIFDRLSRDGELIVDEVFKLEEVDKLWKALSKRTGATIMPEHKNKGSRVDDIVWSQEALQLVEDMHAVDLEVFKYDSRIGKARQSA